MIMEANTLNPDQSDPNGAILSGYFAMYATKEHNQMREDVAKVTGQRLVNPLKGPELSSLN